MTAANLRKLEPVPHRDVTFDGGFWASRLETNRKITLPLEYELNVKNGVLAAYQWDWWDRAKGNPPWRIWVGDLGKWIEAAAYSLATHPDAELEQKVEAVVQSIVKGQKEDGYIYPNALPREWRWARLEHWHEFYEVGHDIEGAVALWRATGKRDFMDAVRRCADLMEANFGEEAGKRRGYDGHPEIELALVKLYRATGEPRYLKLSKFFVDERGREPNYFLQERERSKELGLARDWWNQPGAMAYMQAHRPLRDQDEAVGHAVRALYLYCGAADVAAETGDAQLLAACRRLWQSVVRRRMYVIGGAGSSAYGERFTRDYDLPNETAYAETCANIALVFFAHRLLQIDADAQYADVMERALYNGVLSGVSLDGRRFFYANHLSVHPDPAESGTDHTAAVRQEWFGCACCPPNVARLLASLGQYVYSTSSAGIFVHLYAAGSTACEAGGTRVRLRQTTDYPWDGRVSIAVEPEAPARFALALRIPGWCRGATIKVNGRRVALGRLVHKGYAVLKRAWRAGDRVELALPMPVERIEANPAVRMDCGKVALQRGPLVYCLEETDNGPQLADLALPRGAELKAARDPRLLGGTVVITGKARRRDGKGWKDALYRPARSGRRTVAMRAVPYCLWANRAPGEMIVWIRDVP